MRGLILKLMLRTRNVVGMHRAGTETWTSSVSLSVRPKPGEATTLSQWYPAMFIQAGNGRIPLCNVRAQLTSS